MAGRPKIANPRSRLIGVRVTASEGDVLDAMAALEKTTVSEIVRQSMQRAILAALQDDHVKEMVELQHRHSRRATADVVPLVPHPVSEARR
jgi:hypothetical protein